MQSHSGLDPEILKRFTVRIQSKSQKFVIVRIQSSPMLISGGRLPKKEQTKIPSPISSCVSPMAMTLSVTVPFVLGRFPVYCAGAWTRIYKPSCFHLFYQNKTTVNQK